MSDSFLQTGFSFVTLLVLARLVGPEEFGVAAVALSIVQVLALFSEVLLQDAIVQRLEMDSATANAAFWVSTLSGLALSAGTAVAGGCLYLKGHGGHLGAVLAVMGVSLIFGGIGAVPVALHRRELNFRALTRRTFVARCVSGMIGVLMALMGTGVWALCAQQVCTALFSSAAVWQELSFRPAWPVQWRLARGLCSYGGRAMAAQFLMHAGTRLWVVIVAGVLGPVAAGYFNLAQRVVETPRDAIGTAINSVALSLFSRRQTEPAKFWELYNEAAGLVVCFVAAPFAIFCVLAPQIIGTVLGQAWLPAAPAAGIFAFAAVPHMLRILHPPVINALGRPGLLFWVNAAAILVSLGAFLLPILINGACTLSLAAMSLALRVVVTLAMGAVLLRACFGISFRRQFAPYALPLVLILMATGVAWLVAWKVAPAGLALSGLAGGMGGVAVYGALLAWLGPECVKTVWRTYVPRWRPVAQPEVSV
ncbi:MAG: oligosaccharide flippase family protein [Chthoniobacter sp.]|uniref:oligosaccharide flippase family protein n=1 Tax=Chthoniobacter sp. TaxID=2510640 RepID=UPI0032A6CA30